MPDINKQKNTSTSKKSLFEYFTEIVGWLQIVASPLVAGLIIGGIVYLPKPNTIKLIIAIVIATIGLCVGIVWATKVWRKQGTIHFMSRIMATPEMDKPDEDQK